MKCRYQLAGGLRHSNNKDSYPRWDSFTKLISSKAGSHPWIILPSSSCPDWAGWARVLSWLLWQPDRSAPINIHIIGKQGGWWSVMSGCSCRPRARVSSPCTDRELRYFGEVESMLCHWGAQQQQQQQQSPTPARPTLSMLHPDALSSAHSGVTWIYTHLPSIAFTRPSEWLPRIVGASQCLSRGREARPKCHRRYNLSCGCAVTVLPPVAPQVCEIHDSSLCFLFLERISSAS